MKIRLDEQDIDNLELASELTGYDFIGNVKDRTITEQDLLAALDNIVEEYQKIYWELNSDEG